MEYKRARLSPHFASVVDLLKQETIGTSFNDREAARVSLT